MNSKTKKANNQVNSVINVQEQKEMVEKANHILGKATVLNLMFLSPVNSLPIIFQWSAAGYLWNFHE